MLRNIFLLLLVSLPHMQCTSSHVTCKKMHPAIPSVLSLPRWGAASACLSTDHVAASFLSPTLALSVTDCMLPVLVATLPSSHELRGCSAHVVWHTKQSTECLPMAGVSDWGHQACVGRAALHKQHAAYQLHSHICTGEGHKYDCKFCEYRPAMHHGG